MATTIEQRLQAHLQPLLSVALIVRAKRRLLSPTLN